MRTRLWQGVLKEQVRILIVRYWCGGMSVGKCECVRRMKRRGELLLAGVMWIQMVLLLMTTRQRGMRIGWCGGGSDWFRIGLVVVDGFAFVCGSVADPQLCCPRLPLTFPVAQKPKIWCFCSHYRHPSAFVSVFLSASPSDPASLYLTVTQIRAPQLWGGLVPRLLGVFLGRLRCSNLKEGTFDIQLLPE